MNLNCSSHSTIGIPISFLVPTWSFPSTELVSYWLCLQVPWGHFPILFCSGVRPFLSSLEEPLLPYFLSLFCAWNSTREMEQDTKNVQSSTWICGKKIQEIFNWVSCLLCIAALRDWPRTVSRDYPIKGRSDDYLDLLGFPTLNWLGLLCLDRTIKQTFNPATEYHREHKEKNEMDYFTAKKPRPSSTPGGRMGLLRTSNST